MAIIYNIGNDLDLDVVMDVYRTSTLGNRRPIDDPIRMAQMLRGANLVITAWDDAKMVGIARSLTDHTYCTYLADLAVRADYQRQGIGKELMRRTQAAAAPATIYLFAAPDAVPYYPHTGFTAGDGFILKFTDQIR
jgi:predicted N-acetyltransferase YhbS